MDDDNVLQEKVGHREPLAVSRRNSDRRRAIIIIEDIIYYIAILGSEQH